MSQLRKQMIETYQEIKSIRPKVAYYGEAKFGDNVTLECTVLEDGRRGYVMKTLRSAIGIGWNMPLPRFKRFLEKNAPNALKYMNETSSAFEVQMPNGAKAVWVEEGILTDVSSDIIETALDGKLRDDQWQMVGRCKTIIKALAKVGERGLIDEATGYQWHREPEALQLLLSRLLRGEPADWERRFTPDYYRALCKLFGFSYGSRHRALPSIIGKITDEWIYQPVLPPEIRMEIKERKSSEKTHQWLTDEGVGQIRKQMDAVTAIAASSVDYRDFDARCSAAFPKLGQQVKMVFPTGEAA